jgi:hypothetical protein
MTDLENEIEAKAKAAGFTFANAMLKLASSHSLCGPPSKVFELGRADPVHGIFDDACDPLSAAHAVWRCGAKLGRRDRWRQGAGAELIKQSGCGA